MKFYIGADSGSGQEFNNKEDFLKELSLMIDDCEANGGTQFDVTVDADASCFYDPSDDNLGDDKKSNCGCAFWLWGSVPGEEGVGYYCKKKKQFFPADKHKNFVKFCAKCQFTS